MCRSSSRIQTVSLLVVVVDYDDDYERSAILHILCFRWAKISFLTREERGLLEEAFIFYAFQGLINLLTRQLMPNFKWLGVGKCDFEVVVAISCSSFNPFLG